jgi:hypothetical protein
LILFFFFCFVFWGMGIWTQGLRLGRQAIYHLSHSTSSLFFFSNMGI